MAKKRIRRVQSWGDDPVKWLWLAFIVAGHTDECVLGWPYSRYHGYAELTYDGQKRPAHHVLLGWMGHGNRAEGRECRHLCGNGHLGCLNKRHLRWGTRTENQADRLAHGTSNRGERCGSAKLTEAQVLEIAASTEPLYILADRYGMGRSAVRSIRIGNSWAWLTGIDPDVPHPTRRRYT